MKKKAAPAQLLLIYMLLVPAVFLVGTFAYYPAVNGIYHSLFRWNGNDINEYVGFANYKRIFTDAVLMRSFGVLGILIVANLFKMIPPIIAAVCIHRLASGKWRYYYRVLFVVPMIIPGMVGLLLWRFFYSSTGGVLNRLLNASGLMNVFIWIDTHWLGWNAFVEGQSPAWLGNTHLILPSVIFFGFPWVGIIGVLIYLAGLGNISEDIYEAADLDGVGPFRKFTHIELPLIMTQVRLNLVLMIIATIKGFHVILILLGGAGGPGGVAMVPGLYMFSKAFGSGEAGYASAIGVILFFIILLLTVINQKYVRVDK